MSQRLGSFVFFARERKDSLFTKEPRCNRVRDRYEDKVAHTLAMRAAQAKAVASYANSVKGVTCDTRAS
jgi:hypothetical protein